MGIPPGQVCGVVEVSATLMDESVAAIDRLADVNHGKWGVVDVVSSRAMFKMLFKISCEPVNATYLPI